MEEKKLCHNADSGWRGENATVAHNAHGEMQNAKCTVPQARVDAQRKYSCKRRMTFTCVGSKQNNKQKVTDDEGTQKARPGNFQQDHGLLKKGKPFRAAKTKEESMKRREATQL
jgi:hypothetical protein